MVGTVTGRPVFSVKTIELRGWWGEDSTEALSPWGQILYEQMKYFKREGQKAKTTDSALGYSCLSQLFSYSRHPGLSGPPLPLSPMTPIQAQNSGHCFRCWADGTIITHHLPLLNKQDRGHPHYRCLLLKFWILKRMRKTSSCLLIYKHRSQPIQTSQEQTLFEPFLGGSKFDRIWG